jgi:hypothetical protein
MLHPAPEHDWVVLVLVLVLVLVERAITSQVPGVQHMWLIVVCVECSGASWSGRMHKYFCTLCHAALKSLRLCACCFMTVGKFPLLLQL